MFSSAATPVLISYWESPVPAEGQWSYLDTGRRLSSLVFAAIYHVNHPPDAFSVEPEVQYRFIALVFFDVGLQNRVKDIIRRKTVGIFLIRLQFGRGRLCQDTFRDDYPAGTAVFP